MNTPAIVPPVLSYLFHRLEQRFTGEPTLLILDEAWLFLIDPIFLAKIKEWLKVLRKKNVSVVFATQSLADVADSPIMPVLLESCFSKIYLPNTEALSQSTKKVYIEFGLNEQQCQILANSIKKRHYYYVSNEGSRLFELGLGPLTLAYVAASGSEDRSAADKILSEFGKEGFNSQWIRFKGLDEYLDLYDKLVA